MLRVMAKERQLSALATRLPDIDEEERKLED